MVAGVPVPLALAEALAMGAACGFVNGALIAHSLEAAILLCNDDTEPFLIGGAELYKTGFETDNHGLVKQIVDGKAIYYVDCVEK